MRDAREAPLTSEEIAEKVRARKARTRYGALFAIGGFVAALVSAFWLRELAFAALFMGVSAVGAGFADPSEIKGFWK